MAGLYTVPTGQVVGVYVHACAPASEILPLAHLVHCEAPAVAYEPAAHSEHDCERADRANDPGAH